MFMQGASYAQKVNMCVFWGCAWEEVLKNINCAYGNSKFRNLCCRQ